MNTEKKRKHIQQQIEDLQSQHVKSLTRKAHNKAPTDTAKIQAKLTELRKQLAALG